MGTFTKRFTINTQKPGDMIDLTYQVEDIIRSSGIKQGIVHIFAPHATAVFALTEFEGNLKRDIENLLNQIAPVSRHWHHPNNAHSHLRSMLMPPDRTLPVRDGHLVTGTWQSLFFVEAGISGRKVNIEVTVIGE